jgi:hypothetical protein
LELPEASTIVTKTLTGKDGFNLLCTLRDGDGNSLLHKMAEMETNLLALHYKPRLNPTLGIENIFPS